MKESKEWKMVVEIMEVKDRLDTAEQEQFIADLFLNLDPHLPFLEQQSENQEKWLNYIYEKFVNEDDETAEEFYEEER